MSKKIILIIILAISVFTLFFIHNNDFIYKNEIMKITDIKVINEETSMNSIGIEEKHSNIEITGIITNNKNKGNIKVIEYEQTNSSVVTDKYKVNDKVFVDNNSILGLKRDFYVALMFIIFVVALYIVGEFKGLLALFSVIINSIIFYIGLLLYFKGINLLFLCVIESIIFSIISLFIAGGINKKTISAIISTIMTSLILLLILVILAKITNYEGINFNELSYLTIPPEHIVLPELFIGILGVSMDVAITISSSIAELIEKNKKISTKKLNKSSKEIGKDIMSTMSNVLFFTYICSGLPIFVLALRNGFSLYNYVLTNFSFEITRFLVGSIGILMTIPISSFVSIKVFKRGVK